MIHLKSVNSERPEGAPQSGTGLDPKLAGLLSYLFGWVTGVFFLFFEKNKAVRFHALQSIFFTVPLTLLLVFLSFIPIIGEPLAVILGLMGAAVLVVCMLKTYQGERYKLPYIGEIAEKWQDKINF